MNRIRFIASFLLITILISSCATSKVVVSHGIDLSEYSYVVFGSESTGDRELDDVLLSVQNEIAKTRLSVLSAPEGSAIASKGEKVLTPNIHVASEKWDGGHTYITINFYDYSTNQSVAVIKSSGIGLTVSHDQNIALTALRKKLIGIFGL